MIIIRIYLYFLVAVVVGICLIIMSSCGSLKVSGETKHTVQGTATIRLEVDASLCDSLPEADRAACIEKLLDLLTKAQGETAK